MTCYSWEGLLKPLALIGASSATEKWDDWSSLLALSDHFGFVAYDFFTSMDKLGSTRQFSRYDVDFLQVFWEF